MRYRKLFVLLHICCKNLEKPGRLVRVNLALFATLRSILSGLAAFPFLTG
jgi:hypothetical protein